MLMKNVMKWRKWHSTAIMYGNNSVSIMKISWRKKLANNGNGGNNM
jgi:hypothetical protein